MAGSEWKPFVATGRLDNGQQTYEVQVVEDTNPGGRGTTRYRHPSFGQIRVSRFTGATKGRLFQSNVDTGSGISITISRAELVRNLSNDHLHQTEELITVYLSPAQWAQLLVEMNTMGVPCTINHYREPGPMVGVAYPEDFDNELARIEREFEDAIKGLELYSPEDEAAFKALAAKLPKKDAALLLSLLHRVDRTVKDSIPFIRSMFEESVERTLTQAKSEFAAHVATGLRAAGLEHLAGQAPEMQLPALREKTGEEQG